MTRIRVGIAGGAGFTAGELLRILLHHPNAYVACVYSSSQAGKPVHAVHHDLLGLTDLCFSDDMDPSVDVLFLCLGHGQSGEFLAQHRISDRTAVIDLSNEFRLEGDHGYLYGLPELQYQQISRMRALHGPGRVANPGCFATAIQLALLPLAHAGLLPDEVHVNAITGSTGAGQSPSPTTHFSWREGNISIYKAFAHQHLGEIRRSLRQLQEGWDGKVHFIPVRGNFTRGIFATAYMRYGGTLDEAKELFRAYYASAHFTRLSDEPIHLKQVVNTNQCVLHLELHDGQLLVSSAIDNLLKGASGQAVQNMNLLFGRPQHEGLQLKASFF